MITTYEQYLEKERSLSWEQMNSLHQSIVKEIEGDEEAEEIYSELMETAVRYLEFRSNWLVWSRNIRMERDSSRTACHNSLIIKFNMLARYLKMQGKSVDWREQLGYEEDDRYNRKAIGDFGCYLAFVNSLNAR